jgi:hypothetical protein
LGGHEKQWGAEAERHDGHTERKRARSVCSVILSAILDTRSAGSSHQLMVCTPCLAGSVEASS